MSTLAVLVVGLIGVTLAVGIFYYVGRLTPTLKYGQMTEREVIGRLESGIAAEREGRQRAEALASKLADALERERERYHALASSLVPKAASTPVSDEAIAHLMTRTDQGIPLAIMHALDNVAPGASDPRLRAHLYQWAMQPEQRERMQTLTGLAGVVDEIIRGKQRSA